MENLVNKFWRIWTSKYSLFVYEFKTLDFYFSWFFFLPYAFSNHLIVKKNPHLHCVTENYTLIRYFVNWYGMLRGYTVSNTCLLFPDSSLILDPPPILLFFRRCPYLPFSEINIKMTFILGHSYFKGIYSVYVEDGLCITLMDSKGQLLLNELSN